MTFNAGCGNRFFNHRTKVVIAAASLLVVFGVIVTLCCGDFILNSYFKGRIEKTFAAANPGRTLLLGLMRYSWKNDQLVADSISVKGRDFNFSTGLVAVQHVRWTQIMERNPPLFGVLSRATLEATNVAVEFSNPHYEFRCARLEASVPASALSGEVISLLPQMGDNEFFAAHPFRTTRFRVAIPSFRAEGLGYAEMLAGTAFRAQLLQLSNLELDALVDRERATNPNAQPELMVNEALATISKTIALDSLNITNGQVKYCERLAADAVPGVVTFGAIQFSAKGLLSVGLAGTAIDVQAQGNLMDAGTFKLAMSLPLVSSNFSLNYSGSVGAMEVARFNAFLETDQDIRITSGQTESVAFDVQVNDGHASGRVQPIYHDLRIAFLDHETGTQKGLKNRIESILANDFKIRESSLPDEAGKIRIGKVNYDRKPGDTFLQFVWFALRSGVLNSIGL